MRTDCWQRRPSLPLVPGAVAGGGRDDRDVGAHRHRRTSFNEARRGATTPRHDDQIELTEVPFAELVQKYATAIAGGQAPDALSLDLIYTPAFAAAGQLEDLTDWAKSLPYFNDLSPSPRQARHLSRTASTACRSRSRPRSSPGTRSSTRQAGLDPEKAPTNWDEIAANAEKISALGGDTYGFYFSGGSCGGCMIFTFTPLIWASGADILSEDGTHRDARHAADAQGDRLLPRHGREGPRARRRRQRQRRQLPRRFTNGKIGQQSLGAFAIGTLVTQYPDIDFGVTLIPGNEGGPSSFAGGDNFVITKGTPKLDGGQGVPRIHLFARGPDDPGEIRQPADARRHRRRGAGRPRPAAPGRPSRRWRWPRRPIRCSSTT